jgi:hypothetical protein
MGENEETTPLFFSAGSHMVHGNEVSDKWLDIQINII